MILLLDEVIVISVGSNVIEGKERTSSGLELSFRVAFTHHSILGDQQM